MKLPAFVLRWLQRRADRILATRTPDFVVGANNPDGAYLLRWYLIPRNRLFNVYLHRFLRDDDDRALHDHPWCSASIMLRGGYVEHTIADGGIHRREYIDPGTLRFLRAKRAHRVELIRWADSDPAPCDEYADDDSGGGSFSILPSVEAITLFITGPRIRRWGFHCPQRGWVDFEQFTQPGNTGETGAGCDA